MWSPELNTQSPCFPRKKAKTHPKYLTSRQWMSPTGKEPFAAPPRKPSQQPLSPHTLAPQFRGPADPQPAVLPCSGKVGAGLAVQSVAVTSTAQKRRHLQLHIPVLHLEVGDKPPGLHGYLSSICLLELPLGKETISIIEAGGRGQGKEETALCPQWGQPVQKDA